MMILWRAFFILYSVCNNVAESYVWGLSICHEQVVEKHKYLKNNKKKNKILLQTNEAKQDI